MPDSPGAAREPSASGYDVAGAVGSVIAVAIGGAALWNARDFSPLGSVFPRTISILMILLGLLYLGLVFKARTRRMPPLEGSRWRRVAVAVVMLAWAFLLVPIGFLGSSAAAIAALLVIANHDPWSPRTVLGYGAAGAFVLGAFYVLFKLVLLVPLP
jgi:putative tricarboxylic transport membrane protein